MKKSLALLLALFMILSVFAACGEKQQPAVTDGSDTAAATDGQSTTPPESTDEPEDGEKEATEITPPDMPAIITTDPAAQGQSGETQQTPQTGTPQAQTPQTQTQEPQTGTQQQTQTPTQPAQTTTPAPVANKTEYKAFFFGDSFIVNNAMADNIIAFARYDGIKLTIRNSDYDNNGTISTYNFYERFNYSGETATGVKDTNYLLQSVLTKQNEYDFFLLLTGRDRTVSMTANGNKTFSAYELAQKQYLAANPNGRIILLVPSGYEEGNDGKLAEKIGLKAGSLKEHNALIKQYAARLASVSPADKTLMSQMGDAFDFFRTNYGSSGIELYDHSHIYPSNAASYYMACILYAQMFGKSAYGMKEYGFLDEETATLMQKAAHRFVFGKEPSGTHAADKYVPSYEEINPKTASKRDPRFANEKYPQYYDELIATMYSIFARERWAQYDQMGIDKVKFTSIRRSIYTLPESINPQNTVYLDCSGFTFSTFMNAFGYNFDDPNMRTEYLINYDKGRVMSWNGMNPDIPAEEAKEKLWGLLEPGDVIVHRDETNESTSKWYGHVMIYAGNGMIMHCSGSSHSGGGSADYNFDANLDGKEYLGGIIYEPVDYLFDKDGKQAMFNGNRRINILRPLSLGIKPTEQAVLRAKNLAGIIAYKESSAPRGTTVNPGEDVTFTYVLRNDTGASKTVEIVDSLPEGVTFKSGDAKYQDGKLTTSVTLPSHQTTRLSFTVTVNSSVKNGTVIANQLGTVGGVTLNDAPIYVAKTLSASDRSKIDAAARKVSASNDYEMVSKVYKEALGKDLPFKSKDDLFAKTLLLSSDGKYYTLAENRNPDLIACLLAGGRALGTNINNTRTRNFERKHLMTGDVILSVNIGAAPELWLCLDGGALAVIQNGAVKILPVGTAINKIETLFGQSAFVLVRPSQGM